MVNFKLVSKILIIIIFSLLFLFLFSSYVPFNMDEFLQYHALSYWLYPLNALNIFREAYCSFDLAPISNYYLSLRSYAYVGSFPCIIYYPLFKLWPSPYSARLLGLIMLIIQAFFIHKLFKVDLLISFIFMLSFMPYVFQHMVDTGPIAFHVTSVFFICYLAQKWIISLESDYKHSWKYPLFIGLIIFLGIWVKLAYFFILPGIFILIFYYIVSKRSIFTSLLYTKIEKLVLHLMILFFAAGIPGFILLNSIDRYGHKYYILTTEFLSSNIFHFKAWLQHFWHLAAYFTNPLKTAHRVFDVEGCITLSGILLVTVVIVLLSFGIRQCYIKKSEISFPILNILLFFLTFFLISKSQKTWAMHHVVLSFPFLLLALFYICSKLYKNKLIMILIIAFLGVNFSLYSGLARLKYNPHDHPSKLKLNNLLNERYANQYIFIVIDWGMYYLKALYGNKNQCVLYIEPFKYMKQVMKVKKILNKTKRKALLIGRIDSNSDLSLIKQNFPDIIELKTDFDTGKWRIWYEP